jgi:DNA helicase-2/ATP-dependent DNA helicase PcrA
VKFFERQHIRDLVALLRFVYNPADEQAWERIAVLLPKVGEKGAQKIHAAALGHASARRGTSSTRSADEEVRSRVPKDAPEEWDSLAVSLKQVADSMQTGRPARRSRRRSTAGTATT